MTQIDRIKELIGRNRELLFQYKESSKEFSNPIGKYIRESTYNKYNNKIWNAMIANNRFSDSGNTHYIDPFDCKKYYDPFHMPVKQPHIIETVIRYKLKENVLDLLEKDLGEIERELGELNDTN
jgi:hypothetical protein